MAYTVPHTWVPGDFLRASWLNYTTDDLEDHEARILTLEGATAGTGDVVGPATATDNAVARYDGTTGNLIQSSGITIADGATGTLAGTNSGDVTLAGTPDYITVSGQVITRGLVDLATDITGDLPFANLTPASAASKLLGRGSASGAGDYQEVTLGTNLSFSGTTLNASGGGGSGDVVGPSSAVNDRIAVFDGTTGKLLKDGGQTIAGLGGGGGDSTTTAAFASRPAASNDGNLFFPSDGYTVDRDTGSVWAPWGPIFPLTPPVNGDFSWENQGGASVTTTNGGIYLLAPPGAGINYRVRYKTAPATPYTLTVLYLGRPDTSSSQSIGIGFMESSSGKFELLRIESTGLFVTTLSNTGATDANHVGPVVYALNTMTFFRISDDGTNLKYFVSFDGQNFIQLLSRARGTFFTVGPNRLCFFANEQTNVRPVGMTVISWKEA